MTNYKYLIIGGGMTGDAAVKGIRELDTEGSIGMISSETDMPYSRPPLTKGMWKGRPFEKIWRGTDKHNVSFHLGTTVAMIDPAAKRVYDDKGGEYGYEKLLLATGGSAKRLPFGGDDIIYYRTLKHYQHLREMAEQKEKFVVIGSGFIGSEIAAALTMFGKQVTMIFRGNLIGENIYPLELSKYVTDYYRQKGVELVAGDEVTSLEKTGDKFQVSTRGGKTFEADGVVAGLGIQPNIELAKSNEIKVDHGIVVDDHLQTSEPDIYAAGDVAMFPHAALGKLVRVEHEDNALKMGKQAGRNMAGSAEAYTHTPNFYSDLFELGYEAVGELSSKMDMVEDWQEPNQKGVVYYLEDGRVRGVLMWGLRDKVKDAVALMAETGPFKAGNLKGKI
jgi:3-phenylpropionate/trans-cinnamate dioxygenase ferredoxin reductase component